MWWLYLDESGDLGFDFVNKKPSNFFTVCILATSDRNSFKHIGKMVEKTLRRKLNKSREDRVQELKGTNTALSVKKYFFSRIENDKFGIYSVTLNKKRVFEHLTREKDRVYNWIARLTLDKIPFEQATDRVQLVLDKCKAKPEIAEFNNYVLTQLKSRFDPTKVPVAIDHLSSQDDKVLQATDLFAWGIFRKYEKRDRKWYDIFQGKILHDGLYLP